MPQPLPAEVLQVILQAYSTIVSPAELAALATVSHSFRTLVRRQLHTHVEIRSSTSAKQLLDRIARDPALASQAQSLTVSRGTRQRLQTAGKSRKKAQQWVEDSVAEEDIVKLCGRMQNLGAVHLREPAFATLRRRQIAFLAGLSSLRTLSISGRPSSPFNLHTVGQILLTLPNLQNLGLRHLRCYPDAFDALASPSCNLISFALFSTPDITPKQLAWLLSSTTEGESLRFLAFDILPSCHPSLLNAVKWAPVRATSIACTSSQPKAIEDLPLHCPSLRQFTFRASSALSPATLLTACNTFSTVVDLVDRSPAGMGLAPRMLAEALLLRAERRIERISLALGKRDEGGFPALKAVCRSLGITLALGSIEESADEPCVLEPFDALGPVQL
ncbi:hypothetical protein JCM10213_005301 [Rhodosporidiobolus nylandii]